MSNPLSDPFVPVLLLCGDVSAPDPALPCTYENIVESFQVPYSACAMNDAPALPGVLTVVVTVRSEAFSGPCTLEVVHQPPGCERETVRTEQLVLIPGGSYTLGVQLVELPMRRGTHWFFARLDGHDVQRTPLRVMFQDHAGNAS